MKFLKLSVIQRLLLSLALSFSVVLSISMLELRRTDSWPDGATSAFVLIALGAFFILSTINLYLNEKSTGWKRVCTVSSIVISSLVGICVYNDSSSYDDLLIAFFIAIPISFFVILYSKATYLWIKDGFDADSK